MKICSICGFVAAERSTTGSMKLHALRKHNEPDYLSLFEEKTDEKTELPRRSAPKEQKPKAEKPEKVKRFLNKNDPDEAKAIAAGYRFMIENGTNPDNWDLVK